MLKSLLSTFTCTQNAPAELQRGYQKKISRESNIFAIVSRQLEDLKKMAIYFQVSIHFHPRHQGHPRKKNRTKDKNAVFCFLISFYG